MQRIRYAVVFGALALATGCAELGRMTPRTQAAPRSPAGDPPVSTQRIRISLTDGTSLLANPVEPVLDLDPGFPLPPIAWERISDATARTGTWTVVLVDGSRIEARIRPSHLNLDTALGPLKAPVAAMQAMRNTSRDPRFLHRRNLIVHFPFDGLHDTVFPNAADAPLLGELRSTGRWIADGRHGGALALDGLGSVGAVVLKPDPRLDAPIVAGAITVAAWIRIDATEDASMHIVLRDRQLADSPAADMPGHFSPYTRRFRETSHVPVLFTFALDQGRMLRFSWGTAETYTSSSFRSAIARAKDAWIHVAVTADFWSRTCQFYIDGRPSPPERGYPDPGSVRSYSAWGLNIGRIAESSEPRFGRPILGTVPYHGAIDDLVVFDRALSSNEVSTLRQPLVGVPGSAGSEGAYLKDRSACWVLMDDGSRLLGHPSIREFTMTHPDCGTLTVPLDRIARLDFQVETGLHRLEDRLGNILYGRCQPADLSLDGSMGRLDLPWHGIRSILTLSAPSATPGPPNDIKPHGRSP